MTRHAVVMVVMVWAAAVCAQATADTKPSAETASAAEATLDLPAGYAEQPGAADADIASLRADPRTVRVDAHVFVAPNEVLLSRVALEAKPTVPLSQRVLLDLEREGRLGIPGTTLHISSERSWQNDQLVADSVDTARGLRAHQRRIYAADRRGIVHLFAVTCIGPRDQLADCEKAQQSMRLKLAEQATLPAEITPKANRKMVHIIGGAATLALVIGLTMWVIQSARRGSRRRRRRR
jgi:hypothetical protein